MAKGKAKPKKQEPEAPKQDERPIKKIAIVGCSDTKHLAPYVDESWEIWAMNNSFVHVKRQNKWFEIHPIKYENGRYYRRELINPGVFKWSDAFRGQPMQDYMRSLAELDVPVLMQQKWDCIPKSEKYPLERVLKTFSNYFTNSVSYMIALAALEIMDGGYNGHIGCWGVDMATKSEYGPQRPSCEFILGIVAGMGITITIPPEADLLKTRFLYGFQEREQVEWEAKMVNLMNSMAQRQQKTVQKAELLRRQADQYLGAMEGLKEIQRIWSNLYDTKIWKD